MMNQPARWRFRAFLILSFLLICSCLPFSIGMPVAAPETPTDIPQSTSAPAILLPTSPIIPTQAPPTQLPSEEMKPTMTPIPEPPLKITVVYDNVVFDSSLQSAWGFSALVEYHAHTILFDTGGDSPRLLSNLQTLQIDPTYIECIVLSHIHGDHIGGLEGLLATGIQPTVYMIPSFSASYQSRIGQTTTVVSAIPGQQVTDGIYTTGEIQGDCPEQSLVIASEPGLVVITGCAHPGIVRIVQTAQELIGGEVYLVMGGFHLGGASEAQIRSIIDGFREIGVQKVAPSHCTGDRAIAMFQAEYGEDFIPSGLGRTIIVEGDMGP